MPTATINMNYVNAPYVQRKGVTGFLRQDYLTFNVTVATGRDVSRVIQTCGHELCHVKQVMSGKMYHMLKKKEEAEAWIFSSSEMIAYVKEVGDGWR